MGKQEEEAAHRVPQPGHGEGLLVAHTGALDDLGDGVEDLAGHADGGEKVGLTGRVDELLARVVPVEVHDGLLEPEQVIHDADDQVDNGGVSGLVAQVVLPVVIVTLRSELEEAQQGRRELGVMHVLLPGGAVGPNAEALGLGVPLEGVQIKHRGRAQEAGDRDEEARLLLLLENLQHLGLDVQVAALQDGNAQAQGLLDHVAGAALPRRDVVQHHFGDAALSQAALVEFQPHLLNLLLLERGTLTLLLLLAAFLFAAAAGPGHDVAVGHVELVLGQVAGPLHDGGLAEHVDQLCQLICRG